MAVQLSGILDGEPSLETDLGTVWFRKTASGYMGYIPVTYNAEGGDHTLAPDLREPGKGHHPDRHPHHV